MKNFFSKMLKTLAVTAFLIFAGCSDAKKYHDEYEKYYDNAGFVGSIVLFDQKNNTFHIYNEDRVEKRFSPASTFKIMNSLIAFETEIVKSRDQVFKWDSIKRDVSTWNQDLTLAQAYKYSTVPVYQEIAREIGQLRMLEFLVKADYGNKNIGNDISRFWLNGELQISQMEQVKFLRRLYNNELPFSNETMEQVKEIMLTNNEEDYLIYSKTGMTLVEDEGYIGWYVGWVETKDNVIFFANNIESPKFEISFLGSRILIVHNILEDMEYIKPGA